ncbi:MAG: hypothetical protein U1E46_08575 [Hyphomicrobiales bacterium]
MELDNKAPARMKSYLKSIFEQRAEEAHAEKQGISIKEWARILEEERLERERQARLAVASSQLERHWRRIGGPKSIVGLPLGNRIEAQEVISADGKRSYKALFRGGPLQIMDNGSPFGAVQEVIVVNIRLCGIECQIRQEGTDEVYGVISVVGPSGSTIVTKRFPASEVIKLGPERMRISNLNLPLVERGVMQNYVITAALVENDSGDVEVIANKIADKFTSAAASALGAAVGAPAEAVAESESFKEDIATGLAWVFGSVLGMGDDPYNAESVYIRWDDIKEHRFPVQPAVVRNDDPRTIKDWTHRLTLTGVDDGGDIGQYAVFLQVWTEKITTQVL